MIGRDGPVKPFELIRWARAQASTHNLRTLEAHVLLLLATYANDECVAWPSLRTLATDSGLRPTKDGRNSAVSAALQRLEDLRLVWTRQGGSGQSARRELLFGPVVPSAGTEGCAPAREPQPSVSPEGWVPTPGPVPSAYTEGSGGCVPVLPSGYAEGQPSGYTEENYQGNGHKELPEGTARESLPATRKAVLPPSRKAGLRQLGARMAEINSNAREAH